MFRPKIDFLKPDIPAIREEGYHPVDMHLHTRFSDSYTHIGHLLNKAEKTGLGIAITDHNEIRGVKEAISRKSGAMIIPGMELTTKERAHFLLYFFDAKDAYAYYREKVVKKKTGSPYSLTNLSIHDVVEHKTDYNMLVGAAHPFLPVVLGVHKLVERGVLDYSIYGKLDFIEALSGSHTEKMNLRSANLALELGHCFTGGSDAHILKDVGRIVTYAKADTVEGFLDAVTKRKNFVVGKSKNRLSKMEQVPSMSAKHIRYMKPILRDKGRRAVSEGFAYHGSKVKEGMRKIKRRGKTSLSHFSDKIARKP